MSCCVNPQQLEEAAGGDDDVIYAEATPNHLLARGVVQMYKFVTNCSLVVSTVYICSQGFISEQWKVFCKLNSKIVKIQIFCSTDLMFKRNG